MKRCLCLMLVLIVGGCAKPHALHSSSSEYTKATTELYIAQSKRNTAQKEKLHIQQRLALARLEGEIEDLRLRLEEIENRITQLEIEIASALERRERYKPSASSYRNTISSDTVHIGPRGGRYVITPSGKKRYLPRNR